MTKSIKFFLAIAVLAFCQTGPSFAQNKQPELVKAVAPKFPRAAERRQIEGFVTVRYEITSDGAVADIVVIDSKPKGIFENSVKRALGNWKYATSQNGYSGMERTFDFSFTN